MTDPVSQIVANWGNYPKAKANVYQPDNPEETAYLVKALDQLIARGNGKCYGDAALGHSIVDTRRLNRLLEFDPEKGVIWCEAGMLLADLLHHIVPKGWFFHVTPGIKNITVGGAIACDVHGKNHPEKGCFSRWLAKFELLRGDGTVVTCSRQENTDLFWQTCGGMGWTGIILSAEFHLMRISDVFMRQKSVRATRLDDLFQAFEANADWPYAAGWIDCLSGGAEAGRGVVYFARHEAAEPRTNTPLQYPFPKTRNVPFYAPSWLLNPLSIRLHNELLFSRAKTGEQLVNLDRYFYPLDRIQNWNRLYGRRGFIQYQFCLPEHNSREGISQVLKTIRESRDLPFLSVLKRHGERPPEALHSFPIKGYSLALDFPRTRSVPALVQRLDELVWAFGGKIYLAKDACSDARMGRINPSSFGEAKFHSQMRERLLQKAHPAGN